MAPALPQRRTTVHFFRAFSCGGPEMAPALPQRRASVGGFASYAPPAAFSIFAQVSRSATLRLNTGRPGAWSFQSATK